MKSRKSVTLLCVVIFLLCIFINPQVLIVGDAQSWTEKETIALDINKTYSEDRILVVLKPEYSDYNDISDDFLQKIDGLNVSSVKNLTALSNILNTED